MPGATKHPAKQALHEPHASPVLLATSYSRLQSKVDPREVLSLGVIDVACYCAHIICEIILGNAGHLRTSVHAQVVHLQVSTATATPHRELLLDISPGQVPGLYGRVNIASQVHEPQHDVARSKYDDTLVPLAARQLLGMCGCCSPGKPVEASYGNHSGVRKVIVSAFEPRRHVVRILTGVQMQWQSYHSLLSQ